MSRDKILRQRSYWVEMLECAKENKLDNVQVADEIIKGIEEVLTLTITNVKTELE